MKISPCWTFPLYLPGTPALGPGKLTCMDPIRTSFAFRFPKDWGKGVLWELREEGKVTVGGIHLLYSVSVGLPWVSVPQLSCWPGASLHSLELIVHLPLQEREQSPAATSCAILWGLHTAPWWSYSNVSVLVHSCCSNKHTIDWMAYRQQKLLPHSSGGWEFQDQGTCNFNVWWEPASLFIEGCHLSVSSHGEVGKKLSWGLLF